MATKPKKKAAPKAAENETLATPDELTETALAEADEAEKKAPEPKPEPEVATKALPDKSLVTVVVGGSRKTMTMAAYKILMARKKK